MDRVITAKDLKEAVHFRCPKCGCVNYFLASWHISNGKNRCTADGTVVCEGCKRIFKAEDLEVPPGPMIPEPPVNPRYASLKKILDRAFVQASQGKGYERHATGQNFEDQPILSINRLLGDDSGALFQVIKKVQESQRLPVYKAVAERLGAINYLAASIIFLEEKAQNDIDNDDEEDGRNG